MEGKFKKQLILFCIIVVIGFLIYWAGIAAPKKEVISKKQMIEDIYTKEILPWYEVYYKWDGKEQEDPWWMIFKTHKTGGEWKVLEVKNLYKIKNVEEILKFEETLKLAVKFDSKWINEYRFSPQLTRYQKILLLLTAQPMFSEEKDIFYKILNEIKEIEKMKKEGKWGSNLNNTLTNIDVGKIPRNGQITECLRLRPNNLVSSELNLL